MPMTDSTRRYARAVFAIALERGEMDAWQEDLRLLARTLENASFAQFLDAPQVPAARKLELVRTVLGDRVAPLAVNLLALLATRGRCRLVPGILDRYEELVDRDRGVARGEVVSAVPLNDAEREQVARTLQGIVGREIRLTARVDSQIVGGVVARVGDQVVDGSIRSRVDGLRRSLTERRA